MRWEDMALWERKQTLVLNRLRIINQVMGCRYDESPDNPCTFGWRGGAYVVEWLGREVARMPIYDLEAAETAYQRLDAIADALWMARREGMLSTVNVM